MFQFLQSHLKKIFIVLLFFIIPSFCLYFVGGSMGNSGSVAIIFGQKISESDFQSAYRAVYFDAWMRYGTYFKQISKFLALEKEAWTRIMLLKKVKDLNVSVSVEDLRNELTKMFSNLFQNREFDQKEYENFVGRNLNMPVKTFEDMIKDTISIRKLREKVISEVKMSDEDVKNYYFDENNKLQFSYIKIESKDLENQVEVSDDKLLDFFNKDVKRFEMPEKIKLNYILIKKSTFEQNVSVTEDEVKEYYENNREDYLIVNEEEKSEAGEEIDESKELQYKKFEEVKEEIHKQLLNEKAISDLENHVDLLYREMVEKNDFSGVVKAHSLKSNSTEFFDMTKPPKEIGSPGSSQVRDSFELPKYDFCGPYSVKEGWMIIQVEDKKDAFIPKDLEGIKSLVENEFRKEGAKPLAKSKAAEIRQKIIALSDKKTFEEAASDLGYKTYVSGMISIKSKSIQGVGYEPQIIDAAFDLEEDEISKPMSSKDETISIVAQVSKREVPQDEIFLKEKDKYFEKALEDFQKNYYSDWLEKIKAEADMKILMQTPNQ